MILNEKISLTKIELDDTDIKKIPVLKGRTFDECKPEIVVMTVCSDDKHELTAYAQIGNSFYPEFTTTIQVMERAICENGQTLDQALPEYLSRYNANGHFHWDKVIKDFDKNIFARKHNGLQT